MYHARGIFRGGINRRRLNAKPHDRSQREHFGRLNNTPSTRRPSLQHPPIGLDVTRRKVAAIGCPRNHTGGLSEALDCSDPMTVQSSTTVTDFKVRLFSSRKFGMRIAFCSCEPSYTNDENQPCLPSVSSVRRRRRRADAHYRYFLPLPLYILRPHVDGTIFAAQRRSPSSAARVVSDALYPLRLAVCAVDASSMA